MTIKETSKTDEMNKKFPSTPIKQTQEQIDENFELTKRIHEEFLRKSANTEDTKRLTINEFHRNQNYVSSTNFQKYLPHPTTNIKPYGNSL